MNIFKNLPDKEIKKLSRRTIYKPFDFWNSLKNPNRKVTQRSKPSIEVLKQVHIRYISKNIKDDKRILDYGCGIGRIIGCYNVEQHEVIGADISLIYKDEIIKKANEVKLNFKWINVVDNKLPFDDNYFDAAICTQVLMHTKPSDILDVMNELKRVSKKVIIAAKEPHRHLGRHNKHIGKEGKYKGHNYKYNYTQLCKKHGFNIFNIERHGKNIHFCYD